MNHPEPSPTVPPQPAPPRRFRFQVRHLMIGIALLAVVLALAIQLYVIQRQKEELGRWGASLRERERYLRELDDASQQDTKKMEAVFQENTTALEGALRENARQIERYRQAIRGTPPRTVPMRHEALWPDDESRTDPDEEDAPNPCPSERSAP